MDFVAEPDRERRATRPRPAAVDAEPEHHGHERAPGDPPIARSASRLSVGTAVALQRKAGNRAVSHLVAQRHAASVATKQAAGSRQGAASLAVQRLDRGSDQHAPNSGTPTPGSATGTAVAPALSGVGPASTPGAAPASAPSTAPTSSSAAAPVGVAGAPIGSTASAAPIAAAGPASAAAPNGIAPQATAPQAPAAAASRRRAPGGASATGLAALDERAEVHRQAVNQATTQRQTQVREAATAAGGTIQASASQERDRAAASLGAALAQVRLAFATARDGINTQRSAKLDVVRAGARQQRTDLDRTVRDQKSALIALGANKARLATQVGEDQANRAIRECATKAVTARQTGERKAAQYRGYDRGSRIAAVAREMAGAAADEIGRAGREAAQAVRKDASDLAAKFNREAREGADRFEEVRTAARAKIDGEERQAVEGIDKAADDAVAGLRGQHDRLVTQLDQQRAGLGELGQLGAAATRGMAAQADQACTALGAQATQTDAAIGGFCTDVSRSLPGVAPSATGQVVDEADAQLASSVAEFDAQQSAHTAQLTTAFPTGAAQGQQRITTGVGELVGPLTRAAADFEATAADTETRTTEAIGQLATTATDGMAKATTDTDAKLGQTVKDSGIRWDNELADADRQMAGKVDEVLSNQDRALAGLGGKIDEKAEEVEDESWWERALSFVGGFIVGFFEELWELVKGLVIVLLVILAVVVVVLLIAAIIALAVGGLAGLAAAAAFLGVMAKIAGVILLIVAAVGILVMVAVVGWRLYQAWSRDDLSDYERGKLVGRAVVDIASIFVPGRALARLRGWLRLRQLARLVGGEVRLARLLTWAGGDLAALERLAGELRSLDDFEILLTRTASLDEFLQLRRLCNNDLALTLRMLQRARAGELIAAFAEFGNDVALLSRLLTETGSLAGARRMLTLAGGDIARLRRWLTFFNGSGPMEAMFTRIGRDAALLDDLVAGTRNPAELSRLLNRLGNNAPLLRDVILNTDDVAQLDNMLGMLSNDGVRLRQLLTPAGGRPAAATVEQLMSLARSEGRPADNILTLINQANRNPTELARLLGIARRFAGRTRAPTTTVPAPGYSGARLDHFLDGHTYPFFNFARVGPQGKTLWPEVDPGGALTRVEADLQAVCAALRTPGSAVVREANLAPVTTPVTVLPKNWPGGAAAIGPGQVRGPVIVTVGGGFQFGSQGTALPTQVGQLFPKGTGFDHFTEPLLKAIGEIMAIL